MLVRRVSSVVSVLAGVAALMLAPPAQAVDCPQVEVVFARILTVTAGKPITQAITALFTFRTDWGLVMAMTVFSLIPGVLMIFLVRNQIARGFVIRT